MIHHAVRMCYELVVGKMNLFSLTANAKVFLEILFKIKGGGTGHSLNDGLFIMLSQVGWGLIVYVSMAWPVVLTGLFWPDVLQILL